MTPALWAGARPHGPGRRLAAVVVTVAVAASLVVSCGRQAAPPPLPVRPATVEVTMTDFRFDYDPDIPEGRVVFRVRNAGQSDHELDLVSLPDDLPPIDEQLRGTERRAVDAVAVMPTHAPGSTGLFAADLSPGRYAIICFLVDEAGEAHARKGMNSEFRVR